MAWHCGCLSLRNALRVVRDGECARKAKPQMNYISGQLIGRQNHVPLTGEVADLAAGSVSARPTEPGRAEPIGSRCNPRRTAPPPARCAAERCHLSPGAGRRGDVSPRSRLGDGELCQTTTAETERARVVTEGNDGEQSQKDATLAESAAEPIADVAVEVACWWSADSGCLPSHLADYSGLPGGRRAPGQPEKSRLPDQLISGCGRLGPGWDRDKRWLAGPSAEVASSAETRVDPDVCQPARDAPQACCQPPPPRGVESRTDGAPQTPVPPPPPPPAVGRSLHRRPLDTRRLWSGRRPLLVDCAPPQTYGQEVSI